MKTNKRLLPLLPLFVLLFIATPVVAQTEYNVDIVGEATEVETLEDVIANTEQEDLDIDEDGEVLDTSLEGIEVEEVTREPSAFGLFFRNFRENISLGLTRDPIKKAEKQQKFALRAEKLSEFLFEKGKTEQAERILEKSNRLIEKIEEKKEAWINNKDERAQKLIKNFANHQLRRENFLDRIEDKIPAERLEIFQDRRESIIQKNQRLLNAINNENISDEVREHLQKVKERIDSHATEIREHKEEVRELRASGNKEGLEDLREERKQEAQDRREENKERIQEKRTELKSKAENGDEDAQKKFRILNNTQQKIQEERQEKKDERDEVKIKQKVRVEEGRTEVRENIQERRQEVRENIQEKKQEVRENIIERRNNQ